jgi:hypothetical protein
MKHSIIIIFLILFIGCAKDNNLPQEVSACSSDGLLESVTSPDGQEIYIYENGELYTNVNGLCNFELQYFDSDFLNTNYLTDASGTFLIESNGELFPTKSDFIETFENSITFPNLFIRSLTDTNLYWTNFTLQSPAAPAVSDYVALSQCIIEGTCTFIDNKIELVNDPTDNTNKVLKFTSVAPSAEMVTSKSSMSSTINFYQKNSDIWFEADYLIESGIPFSIVDFENSYFYQSPGPRVVIRNNKLEFENKFGEKINIDNNSGMTISQNQWFTLKIHRKYSNENNGII